MKKNKLALLIMLFAAAFMLNACKDNSTTPNPAEPGANYYPNGEGSYYKYDVQTTDSAGSQTSGQRSVTYQQQETKNGTSYQRQTDSLFYAGIYGGSTVSYVRKSGESVYMFLDTTGFSEFIPDTMMQYVTVSSELQLFSSSNTNEWQAFTLSLNYGLSLDIISVKGTVLGMENVSYANTSGDALKVRYRMVLKIPDANNFLNIHTYTYDAYAWFVKDVGIVKWQGNRAIMNAFGSADINLADTSSTATQTLIQYSIK